MGYLHSLIALTHAPLSADQLRISGRIYIGNTAAACAQHNASDRQVKIRRMGTETPDALLLAVSLSVMHSPFLPVMQAESISTNHA